MRIGADDKIAGEHQFLLGQKRVLNAHAPDLAIIPDLLLLREIGKHLALISTALVLGGGEMVGNQDDLFGGKDLCPARFAELFDRQGSGDVVAEGKINGSLDEITRLESLEIRVREKYFFGYGITHMGSKKLKAKRKKRKA